MLSDRLFLLASELMLSMGSMTDANMLGLISEGEDLKCVRKANEIDFLIIVGYLKNEDSYAIIKDLRRRNKKIKVVQWASMDEKMDSICLEHSIFYRFDKSISVDNFMKYLFEIKECPDARLLQYF